MFLELKLLDENGAGPGVVAAPGQTLQIGRLKQQNQLYVADPLLAPVHFAITCEGSQGRVHDLSSAGIQKHAACASQCFTAALRNAPCARECRLNDRSAGGGVYLNGQLVRDAALKDGDVLVAGRSCFSVSLVDTAPAPAPPAAPLGALTGEQQRRALELFRTQKLPLFAIIDAARAPELLNLLRVHAEIYYSLYDGAAGEQLDDVAPYLVELRPRSPLLEALVREQWGNSWGVFAWALSDFKNLRRHLRRFLMVQDTRGKDMYFRFYDPRVLRVFLPTCSAAELGEFCGPIRGFLLEAEQPGNALLCALEQGSSLRVDVVAL